MTSGPTLAFFLGGPLDGRVATIREEGDCYCPRHQIPMPEELVDVIYEWPTDVCVGYRRVPMSQPGRVVLRFDASCPTPATPKCERLITDTWG